MSNTQMKRSANCESAVCAVFHVNIEGFVLSCHLTVSRCVARRIWLHIKRSFSILVHPGDVAETPAFHTAFGSVWPSTLL